MTVAGSYTLVDDKGKILIQVFVSNAELSLYKAAVKKGYMQLW